MDKFLNPTYFINSDSDFVKKTANNIISNGVNKREKAHLQLLKKVKDGAYKKR
ncbi:MAG: hypothetical protein ACTSP9_05705 [Promethearchaeota archaeon]